MHWVLQSNLYAEASFKDLVYQLNIQRVPHTIVKMIPFVGELEPDIDIADTPSGLKVIEINSTNSAGLYVCDVRESVHAINNMRF